MKFPIIRTGRTKTKKVAKLLNPSKEVAVVPDTMEDVEKSDLLKTAGKLLNATVNATDILNLKEMTPVKLKESKLVLGYLNATNSIMKTKMTLFKMVGLGDKVKNAKRYSKRL